MKKDKLYKMVIPYYLSIVSHYENVIDKFNYVRYDLQENLIVFVIADSFVVSFRLTARDELLGQRERQNSFSFFNNNPTMLYRVEISELTDNSVFSFNFSKFSRDIEKASNYFINSFYFLNYHKYFSRFTINSTQPYKTEFDLVNTLAPLLRLEQRNQAWEGWIYNFIIFQFAYNSENGYIVCCTKQNNLHQIARNGFKFIESLAISSKYYNTASNYRTYIENGFAYDKITKLLLHKWLFDYLSLPKKLKKNFSERLLGNIKYTFSRLYIDNTLLIDENKFYILNRANNNDFAQNEFFPATSLHIRWKSEYLVFELCEKIFGKNNVIFQYRPFFLNENGRQLSYDIFIPKIKVAIEYQGKQHFQPIEIFGGEDNLKRQQLRDEKKRILSEKNNITLIYIFFYETLSIDLIMEKINSAIKGESHD